MQIYCLKCKIETETTDMTESKTKNNRNIMKGVCSTCGRNKSVFVCMHACATEPSKVPGIVRATGTPSKIPGGTASGKGFSLNNLVNNLPIEVHQFAETGENIPGGSFNDQQKYSYCGPGTRYVQRIREGYKGINELDSMCKLHDQFYNEYKDTQSRNLSDEALAIRADQIAANQNLDSTQRKDAKFLSGIMRTKARLGLGIGLGVGLGVGGGTSKSVGTSSGTSKKTKNYKRRPGMKH